MERSGKQGARALVWAAAALLVGVAVGAPAVEAATPRIDALSETEVIPGAVIDITGTNFTNVVADCEVTIGGELASVLLADYSVLKVFVPNTLKAGTHDVKVKIGRDASNTVKLKVLDAAKAREDITKRDLGEHEGVGGELDPGRQRFIELDAPYTENRRGELFILVKGSARYPDGCIVFVSLKLDNRFVLSQDAMVAGGRFECELGPFTRRLFAGNYAIEAEFHISQQPSRVRRQVQAAFPDREQRDQMDRALDRQFVRVGSPQDEQEHLRITRLHFETTIFKANERFAELERSFCATGRSAFLGEDGKVKETAWEEWLAKRSLMGLKGEEFQKRANELRAFKTYLSNRGGFDDAKWREWLDYKWRAEVIDIARTHAEFQVGWEIMKYPDAVRDLDEAIGVLLKLSQRRSQELYEKNGIPVPKEDLELAAAEAGMGLVKINPGVVSPARFQQLVQKCESELGIQKK